MKRSSLKPQAESLLFAAVLLLLQPIQTEVVDPVFQIVGLNSCNTASALLPQTHDHSAIMLDDSLDNYCQNMFHLLQQVKYNTRKTV